MSQIFHELKDDILIILNDSASPLELRNASHSLMSKLEKITPVEETRYTAVKDLYLQNGKAICPVDASNCMIDYVRTIQFMKGLVKAIKTRLTQNNHQKVHVCYAGTGPYAALILPSLFVFSPSEVEFTLMEIHPSTVPLLNTTLDTLGISPWIKQVVNADASSYQFEEKDKPDIVISETMQLALRKEMQVPITLNLYPQLKEGGFFIPENIQVSFAKLDREHNIDPTFFIPLVDFRPGSENWDTQLFNPIYVEINPETIQLGAYNYLTHITVFDDLEIQLRESGLTMPLAIKGLEKFTVDNKTRFSIRYQISKEPGFVIEEIV